IILLDAILLSTTVYLSVRLLSSQLEIKLELLLFLFCLLNFYLILQLIDIEEVFGKSLLDKLRYLQSFMCQHISYVH
ncbi:MAG: hypothetical protein ACK5TF_04990, partial [bacterium]